MRRGWIWFLLVLSGVGGILAAITLKHHFQIHTAGLLQESFCNINALFNCDVVAASSYSSLFGIPVAGFGLLYYLIFFLFLLTALLSKNLRAPLVSFLFCLSLIALGYSAYMAYISAAVLNAYCVICIGMYAVNILLTLVLLICLPLKLPLFLKTYIVAIFRPGGDQEVGFKTSFLSLSISALLIMAAGLVFMANAAKPLSLSRSDVAMAINAHFKGSEYNLSIDATQHPLWGNPNAKVTIVEFSDFQCPYCRLAAFSLKPYLLEFKNDVRFVFMNYPLDQSCNDEIQRPMHPWACMIARAGECAHLQGEFWEFHDKMFHDQSRLSDKFVQDAVKKMDLDGPQFDACMQESPSLDMVREDIKAAKNVGLSGTPTVLVNDRLFRFWKYPDILRAVIREEIKKTK